MRTAIEANRENRPRRTRAWAVICWTCGLLLGMASSGTVHANIIVDYDGTPDANHCTLAQAINAANAANNVEPASYGSTTPTGFCLGAASGGNAIQLAIPTITLTSADNYWYGPNALPPIASTIGIFAFTQVTTIRAMHTGDPTPATASAFRLFYVSGGMELPAGSLTIINVVLQGGYAKGGDSFYGGGGAGMGGAIFNQGHLSLRNVSLIGNAARGGANNLGLSSLGGGGMGQDGGSVDGGGFGGDLVGSYGGSGSNGTSSGGGGGGGFLSGSNGGVAVTGGAPGGGNGRLGGAGAAFGNPGGAAGDGGGGGVSDTMVTGGAGGNFGLGGTGGAGGGGGGGGVGGGGGGGVGGSSGGGGFGGGGGGTFSGGGFGGGGSISGASFGAGYEGSISRSTGGAAMGGAIFNHTGTVNLLNVTATGNSAIGGAGSQLCSAPCNGSGLGAVLFNLNGSVTIDFSTLAGNVVASNNGAADSLGPEDGTIYSLAYGDKVEDGMASVATLTIHNSIIHGTHGDGGLQSDVSANVVDGANTNTSSLVYTGKNFIGQSYTVTGVTQTGTSPSTVDPLLGALSIYSALDMMPVLPIGMNSPANDAASSCLEADNSTTLSIDARTAPRPYGAQCDAGAYEFDGDYIFADGADVRL